MTEPAAEHSASDKPLCVDVQQALDEQDYADSEEPPSPALLSNWANMAYAQVESEAAQSTREITIRLVEAQEMIGLNRDYRQKDKPTNVLSFPCEPLYLETENGVVPLTADDELGLDFALLGDIVICHPVIVSEAQEQQKSVSDHYAHMVTHGVLHLCGYDHQEDDSAEQMESLEIRILAEAGIANPYNTA